MSTHSWIIGWQRSWFARVAYCALLCMFLAPLSGCLTAVRLDDGRRIPRIAKFSIQPQEYSEVELSHYGLRTDGVYVDVGFRPVEASPKWDRLGTAFHRFWPNGRVLFRGVGGELSPNDLAAADSFDRATIGYYEFTDDGKLRLEMFHLYGGKWRYGKPLFEIEEDTIWICAPTDPYYGVPVQRGYRFMPFDGLSAEPDW